MERKNYEQILALRHELHAHPELSNQERWTKARLMAFLREHTLLEVHDGGKWFWAAYRAGEEKKNLAFRADFDALPIEELCDVPYKSRIPGVSHKCGHDGHAASLCGLALELETMRPDKNVFLLFQHAEETGDGAYEARSFIPDNRINEIYAYHNLTGAPKGTVVVRHGTSNCASKGMTIEMHGTPTHASLPELGKNPAFALAHITCAIPELIAPGRYTGMVLCTVIQLDVGEHAFGTAASSGRLLVTIRGEHEQEMDALRADLERLSRAQAEKYGLSCAFTIEDAFPETVNDSGCVDRVFAAANALSYPVLEQPEASRGSEDFGHYQKRTSGALFFIGGGEDVPSFHTAAYDFTDEIMENAIEMFKKIIELS